MRRVLGIVTMVAGLGSAALPAAAAVEVLEAEGRLQHWILYGSSHGPCAQSGWTHTVDEGVSFDLVANHQFEACIESAWTGRCDAGGLLWTGELGPAPDRLHGWWLHVESRIDVLVRVTAPTRLAASRDVAGVFPAAAHTVQVTLPDGSVDVLLGADEAVTAAERTLAAGTYRVTLAVDVDDTWRSPFSFAGVVAVTWDGVVDAEPASWGAVKSDYRSLR